MKLLRHTFTNFRWTIFIFFFSLSFTTSALAEEACQNEKTAFESAKVQFDQMTKDERGNLLREGTIVIGLSQARATTLDTSLRYAACLNQYYDQADRDAYQESEL